MCLDSPLQVGLPSLSRRSERWSAPTIHGSVVDAAQRARARRSSGCVPTRRERVGRRTPTIEAPAPRHGRHGRRSDATGPSLRRRVPFSAETGRSRARNGSSGLGHSRCRARRPRTRLNLPWSGCRPRSHSRRRRSGAARRSLPRGWRRTARTTTGLGVTAASPSPGAATLREEVRCEETRRNREQDRENRNQQRDTIRT